MLYMQSKVPLITIKLHFRHIILTISQIKDPKFKRIGPSGYTLVLVKIAPTIIIDVANHSK